jgi:hypothetical protein
VTWGVIALLAIGVWSQRLVGMFAGGALLDRVPLFARLASLIPAAVVGAVIIQLTIADGRSLTLDARSVGVAVAGVLVWRRAPVIVVVTAAAVVTALIRL